MAIKKRLLSKLKNINISLDLTSRGNNRERHSLLQRLTEAQSLCKDGLPKACYKIYEEVYDGLIMALGQIQSDEVADNAQEIMSLCKDLLQHIMTETSKEEKFKKEMVFIPYKASMWDSLESIWRAANEDTEHCITYVIPIPYCDRNPDGTVKEWHCERALFPKYVPTIDWQSVDLKSMHPEVIFTHNPYDSFNAATSIEARYYSQNLREQSELLVYVPYFLTARRWPELQVSMSVYQNMDFMVIQKEHMQIAPNQFSQIKENDIRYFEDYLPPDKLVSLGSPKIDKIYYCEQHPKIPKKWLDFIDGRKVIFYNTSISGILQQGQRFLKKMTYIFDIFSRRKDVVLLWRPHPLMESCVQSVRPELYEEYMAIKQRFLAEQIGIFDDTPDLDMTMAICDGYLGEASSSVVSMFGYAGKPVFLTGDWILWQEPSVMERQALQIGAHIYDDQYSYFMAPRHNVFCRMKRGTGEIEKLLDFGRKPDSKNYSCFIRDEDDRKFYFSPNSAKSICIYDESTGERKDIPFDNPLEFGNFGGILKYEHYLFFMPSRYPALVRLDEKTGELTYYRECLQEILPTVTAQHMELLGPAAWRTYPNLVYITALQSNRIMTFDMATGDYSWQAVGPEDTDCGCIVEEKYGSGVFWLFPWRTKKIRRWDTRTGECEVLGAEAYPADYACQTDWWNLTDQYKFSCILRLDGYIWLLPAYGNMALRLNMAEKKLEPVDMQLPFGWEERKSNYFLQQSPVTSVGWEWIPGCKPWDEDLPERAIQFAYDNHLYWYDFRTRTYREQPCALTEAQLGEWTPSMEESFSQVGIDAPYATVEHRAYRSISQYIDYVKSGIHDREKQRKAWSELANNVDGTCGEKVKEEVLRRLG